MSVLQPSSLIREARSEAAAYEASLEPTRRKRLGQFFTGLPLSRLLTAIALDARARSVIDPMAGHGDLLDAVIERTTGRAQRLVRVQGVEIDPPIAAMCRRRLNEYFDLGGVGTLVVRVGDAFDVHAAGEYAREGYDLVITNPPYVRYQTQATVDDANHLRTPDEIRRDLREIVRGRAERAEWEIWRTLIDSYSGLADLSVPAWILAAALVRPGGVLALVAPATWRSRDYGDIIEYLLARCFRIEYLVEDTQPGWFSDALVRTQLVVARRYDASKTHLPLVERGSDIGSVVTVKVSPQASAHDSLVGAAFPGEDPEGSFSEWLRSVPETGDERMGLAWSVTPLEDLTESVFASVRRRNWLRALEPSASAGPLFRKNRGSSESLVPAALRPLVDGAATELVFPDEAGLSISQGLRTGCNGFFYVEFLEGAPDDSARVRLSSLFNDDEAIVPAACLVPVVRRQSEVDGPVQEERLAGRVLDLSGWVLPEDAEGVERARHLYARQGLPLPRVMPVGLANLVRRAAETIYKSGQEAKRIPELSAVRTNLRSAAAARAPRFWYMLPPFARRHRPDAFVPRICQGIPQVEINHAPPVLIDANFSTIWSESPNWTRHAIRGLLNSSWCRACMESLGTPLGGGALKLEATHLRRLPIPLLSSSEQAFLDAENRALPPDAGHDSIDRCVVERVTGWKRDSPKAVELIRRLKQVAESLCLSRQRRGT